MMTSFPRASKEQLKRSTALVLSALQDQTRYEVKTLKRAIAIAHRAIRESDEEQNKKRMGALIGELTALIHYIEGELEHNITESFDSSGEVEESHSSIV